MIFRVAEEIFKKYPEARIGCLFITSLNNTAPESSTLLSKIKEKEEELTKEFNLDTITQVPFVSRWREVYRSFGAKPSEYRSSIENLIRMALKGRTLSHINTLVDVYNFISLKYRLPVGGEDVDTIKGDLRLTFAMGDEPEVMLLGDQKAEKPFSGEVIYRDDVGVICRCWNWREGARTMLTKKTKNAIIVVEAISSEEYENLDLALDGLMTMITHFTGGYIQRGLLSKDNTKVEFSEPVIVSKR